jgi:phosphatidylglycerophosphate synthase
MPEPLKEPAAWQPFEAVVWLPPGFDAGVTLAGLSLLLRAVLCLQEAGARRVCLLGAQDTTPPADARIRVPVSVGEQPAVDALWLRADVTCHRALPARLAALARGGAEVALARGAEPALLRAGEHDGLWWVPAGRQSELRDTLTANQPAARVVSEALQRDEFVLPVRDAAERARAYRAHLKSLIKPTSGLMEKLYMRPLSRHLTRLFVPTPITPNQMSLVTLGLALYAAYLVSLPERGALVAGGLVHIGMRVVDCVDGELARLRYQASRFGQWLDSVGDGVGMAAFVAGVTVHLSRVSADYVPLGVAGVVAWCVVQAMQYTTALGTGGDGNFQHIEWGHRSKTPTALERVAGQLELLLRIDVISTVYGLMVALDACAALIWTHLLISVPAALYFVNQALKLRRMRARQRAA